MLVSSGLPKLCNHHCCLIPNHPHIPLRSPYLAGVVLSSLGKHSVIVCLNGSVHPENKQTHTAHGLLCLAYAMRIMFSRFILVVACVGAVLVFMNEEYATVLHTGCVWHPCGHSIGQKQAKGRKDFFWFSFKASHSIMMGKAWQGAW